MSIELTRQAVSIVVRGNFNPAIFHPSWFAHHNLLSPREAEAANVQLVHPDAAIFTCDWLQINVARDRFQVSTPQEPYYEALRDLVGGVFALLSHTPLKAMGLNRDFHYTLDLNDKQAHLKQNYLGHRLAPPGDWDKALQSPAMASLTMQGKRPDDLDGYVQAKVEPSNINIIPYGVSVHVNDHYQLDSDKGPASGTDKAEQILVKQWNESMKRGLLIAQTIVSLGDLYDERNR